MKASERKAQQAGFEAAYDSFDDELEFIIEEAVQTATDNFLLVTGATKLDSYGHMRQFAQLVALAAVTRCVSDGAVTITPDYVASDEVQEGRKAKRTPKDKSDGSKVIEGRFSPGQYL